MRSFRAAPPAAAPPSRRALLLLAVASLLLVLVWHWCVLVWRAVAQRGAGGGSPRGWQKVPQI